MQAEREPGSSPLTRGTRRRACWPKCGARFIPAHAGNTTSSSWATTAAAVHPRSRGEHSVATRTGPALVGSSPLTRGTPDRHRRPPAGQRFIPAHAGNTTPRSSRGITRTVHPRSRGEHASAGSWPSREGGSSPLTRGTRLVVLPPRQRGRLIPAHAGNTCRAPAAATTSPVHPRSRGEHRGEGGAEGVYSGSSPLTRGTPRGRERPGLARRFIPAHAGNTGGRASCRCPGSVHPRSRGEHTYSWAASAMVGGSSPLTRGTRLATHRRRLDGRFIPAHAGNTVTRYLLQIEPTVHPRSRGEQLSEGGHAAFTLGSSPLTRGTQRESARKAALRRFIPAHAGNTPQQVGHWSIPSVHPRSRGEHPSRP